MARAPALLPPDLDDPARRQIAEAQRYQTDKPARADTHTRAIIILRHLIVTAGYRIQIDDAHWLAVEFGGGYAIIALSELVDRAVDKVAVQYQMDLTVAGKVIVPGADGVDAERGVAVLWRPEHVILVEVQRVDGEVRVQVELLDAIDLVREDVQDVDVLEAEERVLVDYTQVACLDDQVMHVSRMRRECAFDEMYTTVKKVFFITIIVQTFLLKQLTEKFQITFLQALFVKQSTKNFEITFF